MNWFAHQLRQKIKKLEATDWAKEATKLQNELRETTKLITELQEKDNEKQQEIRALKLDKQELLKLVSEQEKELEQIETNQQEQLRKINLLFDPATKDYKTIDFAGLYVLLEQIAEVLLSSLVLFY